MGRSRDFPKIQPNEFFKSGHKHIKIIWQVSQDFKVKSSSEKFSEEYSGKKYNLNRYKA